MNKRLVLASAVLLSSTLSAQAPAKKRVAVLNFDYATVNSNVAALFGSNQDVGKGIADLLVDQLVRDGTYSVIERKQLDKVLAEQNFSNSDRANPDTAAKLGRILGVEAIIIGSITQFGRDDKTTKVGGGVLDRIGAGKYGLGGANKKESKAVVGITARLIHVETGEVLLSAEGIGSSDRSGVSVLGSGGAGTVAGGDYAVGSSNFGATLLGEATRDAVVKLARQLESEAGRVPTHSVVLAGVVADVNGTVLVINIGSKAGVRSGDRFEVKREMRAITDPVTGRVIRREEAHIGEIAVTDVDELSAVGSFNGPYVPKVGDKVKVISQR